MDLGGTLPSEFGLLTGVTSSKFTDNKFTGTIPTQLGAFQMTEFFFFHSNSLSGPIPTELGRYSIMVKGVRKESVPPRMFKQ